VVREIGGIHFLNTGSVGRPKDGDWRAGYALVNVAARGIDVEFVRTSYDIDRAVQGVLDSELPDAFADYLRSGGGAGSAVR
jgi:hypothetical protein